MQKLILSFIFGLFLTMTYGQGTITEGKMSMSLGSQNALILSLDDTDSRIIEKTMENLSQGICPFEEKQTLR